MSDITDPDYWYDQFRIQVLQGLNDDLRKEIATERARAERLQSLIDQAGHVGYGTAITLALEGQLAELERLKCENTTLATSAACGRMWTELEKLREWFQNSYNLERCEFSPEEWRTLRDKALAERDAARSELKIQSATAEEMFEAVQRKWAESKLSEWEALEQERDALRAQIQVAKATLVRIRGYPFHSEMIGSCMNMADIAKEALAQLGGEKQPICIHEWRCAYGPLDVCSKCGVTEHCDSHVRSKPLPCLECSTIGRKACPEHGGKP